MKRQVCYAFVICCLLSSCWPVDEWTPTFEDGPREGYKPVYADELSLDIEVGSSRPMNQVGQIYTIGNLLLVVEQYEGIHLINNENPESPEPRGFLVVRGCQQLSIKDGILYTNQFSSLLAVDISDIENPTVISRDNEVLNSDYYTASVPPESGHYFECPDPEKGDVVGWEFTMLDSPKCYR